MNESNLAEIKVRPFQSSDLESCRVLWTELTQHHRDIYDDPSIGGDEPGFHFDEHMVRVGSKRVWVAERDGQAVGLVGLIVDGQEAEVEPVVVAAAHRGKGIGRALLEHAVEEANDLGAHYLSVRPVARNVEAIAFFFGAGFRALGHIELFVDLRPHFPGTWKPGPELFGCTFEY